MLPTSSCSAMPDALQTSCLGSLEDEFQKTRPARPGHRRGEDLDQTPAVLGVVLDDLVIVLLGGVRPPARLHFHPHELVLKPSHRSPLSLVRDLTRATQDVGNLLRVSA